MGKKSLVFLCKHCFVLGESKVASLGILSYTGVLKAAGSKSSPTLVQVIAVLGDFSMCLILCA